MDIGELLDKLVDDPFNDALRSQLAEHYYHQGLWSKAHKQLILIKKQRNLLSKEAGMLASCLDELGFTEEADSLRNPESETLIPKPSQPILSLVEDVPVEEKDSDNIVSIKSKSFDQIRFSDIGGLSELKKTIRMQIIEPFLNPEMFVKFGKKPGGGVLLYGPPGCGKTMMARAIANECNMMFIPVSIGEILSPYYGQSEINMSEVFDKARANKPCVLFFDELDALAYGRSKTTSVHARTLSNEFLNQLDGFGKNNEEILFLAATNMPWDVDMAMKRPGRFSRQVFVPPPDHEAKVRILQLKLHNVPCDPLDWDQLAKKMPLFSGADIDGLIEKTKELVIESVIETGVERNITMKDIQYHLSNSIPSTEDWLRTVKNLVKFSGADRSYQAVEIYLKKNNLI